MKFYVYILRCADGSYYAGHTEDLDARFMAHQSGEIPGYTRNRRPVTLAFSQDFDTREDAFARERQIKGWSRAKKEALIACDWNLLQHLSIARGSTGSPRADITAHPERSARSERGEERDESKDRGSTGSPRADPEMPG